MVCIKYNLYINFLVSLCANLLFGFVEPASCIGAGIKPAANAMLNQFPITKRTP